MAHDPIPPELVGLIVDNLTDDIPALKSCSLTARSFVGPTRPHIFRHVEITPPTLESNRQSPCQKLYKLLTSSPHIAPLVQDLTIVLVGSETSFEYDEDGEWLTEPHATWVMTGRTLALVLTLLKPRRISLIENSPMDWNMWGDYSMNWNKLGRTLKSALKEIFSSPTLEAVHLRGIVVDSPRQLLSLFSEATSLKEMSLSRVFFNRRLDQREPWLESEPWRPHLRSLLVSDVASDSICRYLINPGINSAHINSLTVATDSAESGEALTQHVTKSGSVEHLRIRYAVRYPTDAIIKPMLGANLRSICFYVVQTFALLHCLFRVCPHDTVLETITLEGPTDNAIRAAWQPSLDDVVALNLNHFRFLKTVEIKAFLANSRSYFSQWSADVHSAFPTLVRHSMLSVTEAQSPEHTPHHGWE